eukprot:1447108-Rhodomonas_salina.1
MVLAAHSATVSRGRQVNLGEQAFRDQSFDSSWAEPSNRDGVGVAGNSSPQGDPGWILQQSCLEGALAAAELVPT